VTLSPDHPLRKNDPGYVPVFDVQPAHARAVVVAAMAGLLGFFCWHTRRPYQGPGDQEWPRECSAVLVLMLFLSPLTWIQHLPWLVPALYWIVAKGCSQEGLGPMAKTALGLYVMIAVVLNYEVLGKQNYMVFLSFKPFTIGMLLLFVLLMVTPKQRQSLSYFSTFPVTNAK
jgi:alpha-1,2-mannosyltransferase